jgi:hypothetical protein
MKNLKSFSLVLILPLLLLSLFACQGGSSLVSPDNTSVSSEDPNWISLPASDNNQLRKTVSVTQLITAQNSGKISLRDFYKGGPHKKVSISAEIKFEPNTID